MGLRADGQPGSLLPPSHRLGEPQAVLGLQEWCAQAVAGSADSSRWGQFSTYLCSSKRDWGVTAALLSGLGGHGWADSFFGCVCEVLV